MSDTAILLERSPTRSTGSISSGETLECCCGRAITDKASFSASTSFVIAARSGSDAIILRSLRGTPLRRNSLILTITSPRTKLPNSGRKRPSRRASRVQKRFLTAIFFHRGRRAIFERGDTRSAEGLGRNEPDWPLATLASCQYALTPYEVKECPFLWLADVQEAEVIFVNQHLSAPIKVLPILLR